MSQCAVVIMQVARNVCATHAKISEVNLSAFIYKLYHEAFSSIAGTNSVGITLGRVLNGELYVQRLQKLKYLQLFTDSFMKILPQTL